VNDVHFAMKMQSVDCVVVGGGPSGLTAATYLGRFRRDVLLIDDGKSRARWIPKTHNLIGYTEGIGGPELLKRMRDQATAYDAKILHAQVMSISVMGDWDFRITAGDETIQARAVIIATGGLDVEPDLPDIRQAVQAGLVRYCPICDAFEAKGRRIALISYGECRIKEALLLRAYTSDLTVLTLGRDMKIGAQEAEQLEQCAIKIEPAPIMRFSREGAVIAAWPLDGQPPLLFETIYCALGTRFRSELGIALGVEADADGALIVAGHQRTNVPGLYAVGDVVQGLSQITVAAAHAAVAATDVNAHLPVLLSE
jgi:thioredoxin reductase (NADPH)